MLHCNLLFVTVFTTALKLVVFTKYNGMTKFKIFSGPTLWPDQNRLESSVMWCWRRIEKISWTDHVRNEEVLLRVNEQKNILHEIRKRKANWIGHILRRNCLPQKVIEGLKKGADRSDDKTMKKA